MGEEKPGRKLSPHRLRLIVITDAEMAAPRDLVEVVGEALAAGAPAVQLRDKVRGIGEILPLARELRTLTSEHGALFFVNDRVDLALAAGADGAHLGPDDLPVSAVRAVVPDDFILGFSADHPRDARKAVADGADYIGCGTVWPTASKGDAGETIGVEGLERVIAAVPIPVVAIGGITVERASLIPATAAGAAVIGAVMAAPDPGLAVRELLEALESR